MPEFVNKEGQTEELYGSEGTARAASGEVAAEGGTVLLRSQDGDIFNAPAEDLQYYLKNGYTLPSVGETAGIARNTQVQEQYGDFGGALKATAAGALRGASAGLSDLALEGLGVDPETLGYLKEANQGLSLVGEIGGAVAGVGALTGAAGAAVRAGGGLGRAAAGFAAEGALDGAVFQAGQNLSNAVLNSDPITVEAIAAGVPTAALLGAGGTLGLGLAGQSLQKIRRVDDFDELGKSVSTDLKASLTKDLEGIRAVDPGAAARVESARSSLRKALGDDLDLDIANLARKKPKEALEKIKAVDDYHKTLADVDARVGSNMVGDLGDLAAKDVIPVEDVLANQAKRGTMVDDLAPKVDEAPPSVDPRAADKARVNEWLDSVRQKTGGSSNRMGQRYGMQPPSRDTMRAAGVVEREAPNPLTTAEDVVDTKFSYTPNPDLPFVEQVTPEAISLSQKVKPRVSEKLRTKLDEMASLDDNTLATLLKVDVGSLPMNRSAAGDELLKAYAAARAVLVNQGQGVAKTLFQAANAVTGLGTGGVSRAVLNVATAPLRQVAEASQAVQRLKSAITDGALKFARSATGGRVYRGTTKATAPALAKLKYDLTRKSKKDSTGLARMREVATAVKSPGNLQTQLDRSLAPLRVINPQLAFQVADLQQAKLQFLASKLPPTLVSDSLLVKNRMKPSAAEVETWSKYARAAEDPSALVQDLAKGRVTPEAVEAVKSLYPETFREIQTQLLSTLGETNRDLSYQARLQLSLLFEIPLEPSMSPEVVAGIQGMYQTRLAQQTQPPGRGAPSTPQPTKGQRLMER